jgi:site-specific DNA-cytosine methylase
MEGINVLSLFDGISCGQVALERAKVCVNNYFASEIEPNAIKITQKNYPNTIQLGDVTKLNLSELPKIDLLIGGSPCQGFSFAGKQLNFNDERSKLFFEFVKILRELKPKYFLLENVKMKQEYQDIITKELGVEPIQINSSDFSAGLRPRIYWTNIPILKWEDKGIKLTDILESNVEEKYFISEKKKEFIKRHKVKLQFPRDKAFTIPAQFWKQGKQECRNLILDNERWRRFTPIEVERIHTLSDNYTEGISDTQRYATCGNGWTIEVIAHIFKGLFNLSPILSTLPTAIPTGEFNKDLTATQQVASPKCPSDTSLNPDIMPNSCGELQSEVQL